MPGNALYSGRYLIGDGSYGQRRRGGMYGDPGLGALIGLAGAAARKVVPKVAGLFGKKAATIPATTQIAIPTITRAGGGMGRIGKVAGGLATIGAASAAGTAVGELAINMTGVGGYRRYRRMNPLNPKALKRACKRMDGFRSMVKMIDPGSCGCGPKRSTSKRKKTCR